MRRFCGVEMTYAEIGACIDASPKTVQHAALAGHDLDEWATRYVARRVVRRVRRIYEQKHGVKAGTLRVQRHRAREGQSWES